MKKERNATKAGFFILFSAVLIVLIVVAIKGGGAISDPMQNRIVQFSLKDDLGGLRVGDDVRVGGYKVGAVAQIEPADLDGGDPHLMVTFTLPARYRLHTDAQIGVQTSLTGTACVNVASLGSPAKPVADQDLVGVPDPKTVALASLSDLAAISHEVRTGTLPKVNLAVDTFRQTGDSATKLIHHVDEKVDPIVGKYDVVTEKADGALDSIHEMIGPSVKDFHGTMSDLHEITGELKGKLPAMLAKLDADIDGTRAALDSVQKTAENTREISSSVRSLIADNHGKIDSVIASIKSTGDNLKAASVEIRHSPWRLLYQPSSGELSNLNLFDAARQFSDGANELNDAAQALKDAANDKQGDPRKVQEMLNRLEKTFVKFHTVEQKLWTDVKE
jgi:ABC-type transporter Mla subunit MlaD